MFVVYLLSPITPFYIHIVRKIFATLVWLLSQCRQSYHPLLCTTASKISLLFHCCFTVDHTVVSYIAEQNGQILTVRSVSLTDEGSCVAENAAGTTDRVIEVDIHSK